MRYTLFFPDSRFPIPDSRFPIPDSRFPIPDSLLPPKNFYLTELQTAVCFINPMQ
ncbi:MAG: hypothetical protein F6J90_41310 [Moorea sp. SIOASIH]|uniref:hypothetical protein n=1 Tax=Moorena sp. SIOASIH TaxID=2607817 RepID=UPI0013BCA7AC|nr:hypothetical protein [Moorena sp. SIOASIH]NEO42414.1 hypothetical protein [Moorena sp. SIOASIH]